MIKKCDLAKSFDIKTIDTNKENLTDSIKHLTGGIGVDGVIITASTRSDALVSQSAKICRIRGRIILVGVVDLKLNREEFYLKEIKFQVSCSYGPGRYDNQYEQKSIDYPYGYVRWTENRNFKAILRAMEEGLLDFKPLITEKVKFLNFDKIYGNLESKIR